ncbi:DUF927 domain-containing protein [Methylomonas koyamae]|nr:DUF927 domain-containing protein [Methylomonas koyamae]
MAKAVRNSKKRGVTGVTSVTTRNGAAFSGNTTSSQGVTGVTSLETVKQAEADKNPFPPATERDCYRVYDNWCGPKSKWPPGVYWHYMSKGTKEEPPAPVDVRLCGPLRVTATARNKQGREFGQVLEFVDKLKHSKRWNMPSKLLAGRGDDLLRELFDSGLDICYKQRSRIAEYISEQRPKATVWTASACGWFDGVFVLPNQVIGDNAESVMYQCDSAKALDAYTQAGSLDDWQSHVARYCPGNPLLVLAVSQAFSGALLEKCSVDGIGVHIFGESSKGKTSGMLLAGSVWGEPKRFNRSWTATANGLESAATGVNDGLLCLDEMSKAAADEVSNSLYMLANGIGKQRATATGSARALNTWRVSVLSNGEESIEAHLLKAGIIAKAGELVRFLQLPIFGNYGAFNDLHGVESGRAFSTLLAQNSARYYGTAGIAYLEKLTRDKRDFAGYLSQFVAVIEKQDGALSPQEGRAARAFALIGMAGELATEYGITGWLERTAMDAALQCFKQWRNHRGKGELEPKQLVDTVRHYVELYGDARFTSTTDDTRLNGERSGYWREVDSVRQWLFSTAGFKKAIGNADSKQAARLLTAQGVLIPGRSKTVTQVKHSGGTSWFYVIQFNSDAE